ncbi:DMT family transporter [Alkaliphilus hydrothermalis]|uniref:Transporter family-2 protein n=1 Tax=Alkaliphilus hydrothermalis TaxID=1482730 RepID=A0ABS2NR00_9FIRM|nr:DMT family transporter [Alkaliphilus hydrothermalis]MBM7614994.1 transporter family-2 protein [Alkaliphilus hydrothermalis]
MKVKYVIVLLLGVLIAMMININGILGVYTNVYFSSFAVHLIATTGTLGLVAINKEINRRNVQLPFYYYLGGIMGGMIIVLNNVTFQALGVSITIALVLLGQVVTSLLVDSFGLLRMKQIPFKKGKIPGLILMLTGIFIMMFY